MPETQAQTPSTETYRAYADKAQGSRGFISLFTPVIEYAGLMCGVYGAAHDDLRMMVAGGIFYFGARVAGRTMPLIHRDWCFARLEETLREEFKKNNQSTR